MAKQKTRIVLSDLIRQTYNLSELKSLCFDLDIEFDALGGEQTLEAKIQELISYCERRIILFELVEKLKEKRPKIDWPQIPQQKVPISLIPEAKPRRFDSNRFFLPTGFTDLDALLGGLENATLNVVTARPGMGKTIFVTTLAQVVSRRYDQPVLFFSLQLSSSQIRDRIIAVNTGIDLRRFVSNQLSEKEKYLYEAAKESLITMPLEINDDLHITFKKMETECERISSERNLGMIVVDGIEHIWPEIFMPDITIPQYPSARWFQSLARTFNAPTIATLQTGHQVDARNSKRPILQDVPGDWGFIADTIITLYRDDYYNYDSDRPNVVEVNVLKNRNGPTGQIDLFWRGKGGAFYNLQRQEIEL